MHTEHSIVCIGLKWEPEKAPLLPAWQVYEVTELEEAVCLLERLTPFALLCHHPSLKMQPSSSLQRLRQLAPYARLYMVDAELEVPVILTLINDCQVDRFLKQPLDWASLRLELQRVQADVIPQPPEFSSFSLKFSELNRRVLCVDDDDDVLNFYQDCLAPRTNPTLEALALRRQRRRGQVSTQELPLRTSRFFPCDVVTTTSGERAIRLVREAREQGRPFAAGFFDMKMPGGWDGLETLRHLRAVDPQLVSCVVTAYTDHSLYDILQVLPDQSQWMYFHKPFGERELLQTSAHLLQLWNQRQRQSHIEELAAQLRRFVEHASKQRDAQWLAQQLCQLYLGALQSLLGTTLQGLALVGRTKSTLHFEGLTSPLPAAFCEKVACRAIQERQQLMLDVRTSEPSVTQELQQHGLNQLMVLPLKSGVRTLGVILAGHAPGARKFEPEDQELLRVVQEQTLPLLELWWHQHAPYPAKPVSNPFQAHSAGLTHSLPLLTHYFP